MKTVDLYHESPQTFTAIIKKSNPIYLFLQILITELFDKQFKIKTSDDNVD